MLAIYDLGVSPPTYDFVSFLLAAEMYRRESKQNNIHVLIVKGPKNGFRDDNLPPFDVSKREVMLENIVVPMCSLVPSCRGYEIVERNDLLARISDHLTFPPDYRPDSPKLAYGLKFMALAAKQRVYPFFANPMPGYADVVTITLRRADYWPTRNSNIQEWLKVAHELKSRGKRVIFIPDTAGHDDLDGFEVDQRAAKDIVYRLALYVSCPKNLFVNNGPAWLAAFCPQVSGIIFKIFAEGAPCVSPEFYERSGFTPGMQIGRPGFKIVYQDDTAETILREHDSPAEPAPFAYPNAGNTSPSFFLDNMRTNCKRGLPWFTPEPTHAGVMVICGGAPSIRDNIVQIRDRKRRGQTIVALNNAWRFLLQHNITPDIIAAMDSRPENAAFFQDAPMGPSYLIASTAHSSVFDALEGRKVTVWHPDQCQDEQRSILDETANGRPAALIGGGATIGLRMLVVGFLKGYRLFHLYGMDSSHHGETHHAYAQPLNDNEIVIEIHAMGKTYRCSRWMARQADEFQKFYRTLTERGCVIQAHGYGLLPDLCRHHNRQRMEKLKEIA